MGLPPVLVQIYSKTGQWEEAVKVLDTLQAQVSESKRRCPMPCLCAAKRAVPGSFHLLHRSKADVPLVSKHHVESHESHE